MAAFRWGRRAAARSGRRRDARGPAGRQRHAMRAALSQSFDEMVARRVDFLTAYQNAAYAARYRDRVETTKRRRSRQGAGPMRPGRGGRPLPVQADGLQGRVRGGAALRRSGEFLRQVAEARSTASACASTFHLAPPLLARRDPRTGEPRKITFGPWLMPAVPAADAVQVPARHRASTRSATAPSAAPSASSSPTTRRRCRGTVASSMPTTTTSRSGSPPSRKRSAASATSSCATSPPPRPTRPRSSTSSAPGGPHYLKAAE